MGAPLSDDIWVTADAAVYLLDALEGEGIEVWVAGGWGIDALVGRQTRQHRDLDLLLPLPKTLAALHALQAAQIGADILTTPWAHLQAMMRHPLTDIGLEKVLADWEKVKDR